MGHSNLNITDINNMKIAIVGSGYVGLVSGTCFAETGNNVISVDIDKEKVRNLNHGIIPIYEPGLERIFLRNIREKRLKFTTDLKNAVEISDIIFLCLPTPPNEDGSADLSYVLDVSKKISKYSNNYKIIINKSTVPIGTSTKVEEIFDKNSNFDYDVVSNPEFLREGEAVNDFMKPDRIIIGTSSKNAIKTLQHLYEPFVRQGNPIIFMDQVSAELTKYAGNSFLATKISFMNEIAQLCEKVGANVDFIRKGIGSDFRISSKFLYPGIGYGGSCFPKDVKALIKTSHEFNYNFKILNAVEEVNEFQKTYIINKVENYFNNDLKNKNIGIWGLSFKPNTDDIREASSLKIIDVLLSKQVNIKVYDPEALFNVKKIYGPKINYHKNMYDVIDNIDALIIATEWSEFRSPNMIKLKQKLENKVIFDGRNVFKRSEIENLGIKYFSIGR